MKFSCIGWPVAEMNGSRLPFKMQTPSAMDYYLYGDLTCRNHRSPVVWLVIILICRTQLDTGMFNSFAWHLISPLKNPSQNELVTQARQTMAIDR